MRKNNQYEAVKLVVLLLLCFGALFFGYIWYGVQDDVPKVDKKYVRQMKKHVKQIPEISFVSHGSFVGHLKNITVLSSSNIYYSFDNLTNDSFLAPSTLELSRFNRYYLRCKVDSKFRSPIPLDLIKHKHIFNVPDSITNMHTLFEHEKQFEQWINKSFPIIDAPIPHKQLLKEPFKPWCLRVQP